MHGFLHYFLSFLNPMADLGFSHALPTLLSSALIAWWVFVFIPFVFMVLPDIIAWVVYLVKPAVIRPPLPVDSVRAQPLVSVVIAGRNESATIGHCIRGALLCGYPNLEVIFVDDYSSDDSVAIARRAALTVTRSSRDGDRVRIFPSPRRNGKASSLNIGIRMSRGEFIVIHDADSVIQYGAMQHWLLPFADRRVGAVAANIRPLNSTVNLLTRLQEIEYAMNFTMARFTMSRLGILNIISGMGGIFRASILHSLGGLDTGLGDDTDLTTNIYKQGWKLAFSLDAKVWTTVPVTRYHLWRQRMRWRRNLIKIRVSKHRDQFLLGRYGFANAVRAVVIVVGSVLAPPTIVISLLAAVLTFGPLKTPHLLTEIYWLNVLFVLIRTLIARDISSTPLPVNFWLIFLSPFYFLWLLGPLLYAEVAELLRIGAKHPYVPDHIWEEIPWW
jgi:poly-beta-1,6-N-acetyl-D-glucosamine synthase